MIRWLFILCIVFSFIPRAIFNEVDHIILSRITLSDIFGLLGIISLVFTDYKTILNTLQKVKIFRPIGILIAAFIISAVFSLNVYVSFVEVAILLYLCSLCLGFYIVFGTRFDLLIRVIAITLCLTSIIAFYDTFAEVVGVTKLFSHNRSGFVVSGFRTTGQAGVYSMVFLGVLIAYGSSNRYKTLAYRSKALILGTIVFGFVFLLLTGKIGAIIGFGIGSLLFVLLSRKRTFMYSLLSIICTTAIAVFASKWIIPKVYYRLSEKLTNYQGFFVTSKFKATKIYEGWSQALIAFKDHPITGTGIGAFQGSYHTHEVHGGFFKVLVETGIIGLVAYCILIVFLFRIVLRYRQVQLSLYNVQFLRNVLPFLIGFFVAWIYTYPLRKREFWILLSIILIVSCRSQTIKVQKQPKTP